MDMKLFIAIARSCILMLAVLTLPAYAKSDSVVWESVVLPGAKQFDMQSKLTGHRYRIFVSVPHSQPPASGFPVLYVLDGNAMFPVAAFLSRSESSRSEVTGHVAPIVIGIGYPERADFDIEARRRDYTLPTKDKKALAVEGGADRFFEVIEKEIKPKVEAHYHIDRKRQAIFGHSFGGLFVLHTLLGHPSSYSTYIISSPSIWWQDKIVLKGLQAFSELKGSSFPRVQVSVGANEDRIRQGKYSPAMKAMMAKRPMVSEARALATVLRATPGMADRLVYYELEGEDHGQSWLPAMTRGMEFFMAQP